MYFSIGPPEASSELRSNNLAMFWSATTLSLQISQVHVATSLATWMDFKHLFASTRDGSVLRCEAVERALRKGLADLEVNFRMG